MSRILFVLAFFGLTLLPGLQMVTRAGPEMTVDENRSLAPPPTPVTPLDQIPRVADRWFIPSLARRDSAGVFESASV